MYPLCAAREPLGHGVSTPGWRAGGRWHAVDQAWRRAHRRLARAGPCPHHGYRCEYSQYPCEYSQYPCGYSQCPFSSPAPVRPHHGFPRGAMRGCRWVAAGPQLATNPDAFGYYIIGPATGSAGAAFAAIGCAREAEPAQPRCVKSCADSKLTMPESVDHELNIH